MRFGQWAMVLLACLLGAAAHAGAQVPPPSLLFGEVAALQRLVPEPALTARSGGRTLTCVEVQSVPGESAGAPQRARLILQADWPQGGGRPVELSEPPLVVDNLGREVAVSRWRLVGGGEDESGPLWLALYVSSSASALRGVAVSLAASAAVETRQVDLDLDPLGTPRLLPGLDLAVEPTLLRRDDVELDTRPDGPPYFYALDSTRGGAGALDAGPRDGVFVSLRLHTIGAESGADGWVLSGLRMADGGGQVLDDWRFVRRPWRPDWGGWLGVTGHDEEANSMRPAGVKLEAVDADGPAAAAGLRVGDRVVAMDRQAVPDAYTLGGLVRRRRPGSTAVLTLWRGDRSLTMPAKLGGSPQWPDRDENELEAVWSRLATLRAGAKAGDVLDAWDWQARQRVAASFEPKSTQLLFRRRPPAAGVTFLLRDIPLGR